MPPRALRRLRRLNWASALAFTIGGSLFSLGAAVAQVGSGSASTSASIYLVGGVFFTTGAYAALLGVINASGPGRMRWWAYEPMDIAWLAAFVLFTGTLVFGISLVDSFLQGLSTHQENRLIWAPDMVGCILFLISGHLSFVGICRGRGRVLLGDLGWWVTAVNQVGSVLFFASGLAAFVRPLTESAVNVDVANWGTFLGAACFAIGGVMQAFDRPASPAES